MDIFGRKARRTLKEAASELGMAQCLAEGSGMMEDHSHIASRRNNDPMMCYWCVVEDSIAKTMAILERAS